MSTSYYAVDRCSHCKREDRELVMTTSIGWPVRLQGNGVETFSQWVEKYTGRVIVDEYGTYHEFEELIEIAKNCQRRFNENHVQGFLLDPTFDRYEFISEDGYRFTHKDREHD